ncbi:protein kinase domain-containing protein [Nannocystis pusilla]|uniref:serine/threonine-protein kinase n=1 Tax=Nannocystis pusilla TaxID=889268 RepID=UPI003B787DB9
MLEGRFQVERLLGEGGMGRVYVADELRLRRRCALKVLLPELTEDKDCVERFLREAQAIAQIHHEHVVDIYHLGEDVNSGVVFFAMEMLVGKDLETRLLERSRKPLGWQQVTLWMEQVASAMSAVHAAGMIHRDLKPSNVFLTAKRGGGEQVKLLDFGIAKTAHHAALTSTGAALGTPFYMSPEQILAQALDSRTDIYSFGVVLFEALAGRMPFIGEPIQVAMQHCNVPPPTIQAINPDAGVPAELDAYVQRMLAKDRDARPQTMDEIEAVLHDLLAAHGPGPRPSTGPLPIAAPVSAGLQDSAPNHFGPDSTLQSTASAPAARTVLAGSTPASGLPRVDTRTNLDNRRPPASTVEIHFDAGEPGPAPLATSCSCRSWSAPPRWWGCSRSCSAAARTRRPSRRSRSPHRRWRRWTRPSRSSRPPRRPGPTRPKSNLSRRTPRAPPPANLSLRTQPASPRSRTPRARRTPSSRPATRPATSRKIRWPSCGAPPKAAARRTRP